MTTVRTQVAVKDRINALDWSENGELALGYDDGTVRVKSKTDKTSTLDIAALKPVVPADALSPLIPSVGSVAWNPEDDKQLAIGVNLIAMNNGDNQIIFSYILIWNADNGQFTHTQEEPSAVDSVSWNADGQLVAALFRHTVNQAYIVIYEPGTGKSITSSYNHDRHDNSDNFNGTNTFAWRPGKPDQIAVMAGDGQISIWDVKNLTAVATLPGMQMYYQWVSQGFEPTENLAWSPDGERIALDADYSPEENTNVSDPRLQIWDVEGKRLLVDLPANTDLLKWSPNGKRLAMLTYNYLALFNPDTGTLTYVHEFPDAYVNSFAWAWSPDSEQIAAVTATSTNSNAPTQVTMVEVGEMKFEALRISLVCVTATGGTVWQATNSNPVDLNLTWEIPALSLINAGNISVPKATDDVPGKGNFTVYIFGSDSSQQPKPSDASTIRFFAAGVQQAISEPLDFNNTTQCTPDQVPTPN